MEVYFVWKEEEFGEKDVESYMIFYFMYNGLWFIWEKDGLFVVVSYYFEWVFFNGKLWFGMVLIDLVEEKKGYVRVIIE